MIKSVERTELLESFLALLCSILKAFVVALFIILLIESTLDYRKKETPIAVHLKYNFTNNDGEQNTLVVMS